MNISRQSRLYNWFCFIDDQLQYRNEITGGKFVVLILQSIFWLVVLVAIIVSLCYIMVVTPYVIITSHDQEHMIMVYLAGILWILFAWLISVVYCASFPNGRFARLVNRISKLMTIEIND